MSLKNIADKILNRVIEEGAEGDLIVDSVQSLTLKANQGSLEEHKVSSTQVFGLRLVKDNRVGMAYSEATDDDALNTLVKNALTNAQYSVEDKHESILDSSAQLRSEDELLVLEDNTSIDEKIDFVLNMEGDLLRREHIASVPYNNFSETLGERNLFSSKGLQACTREKYFSAYAYALAQQGEANAMEGSGQQERLVKNLNSKALCDEVYQACIDMLPGKAIASKKYDVIFDKEMQSAVFSIFAMALSAKSAKDGINPWREKLGQAVSDERISMWDKPSLSEGFAYCLFDDEGSTCQDTAIIKNGELQTLLHNSATASYFGVANTAHGSRGPKSTLDVSPHQIVVDVGDAANEDLKTGEYLELTHLTGLHSGANEVSGDFSFGASGYLCKNGERQQSVRGITVAGNFYQMLNTIECIGNQSYWNWQKSSLMPSIRFSQLAISGD